VGREGFPELLAVISISETCLLSPEWSMPLHSIFSPKGQIFIVVCLIKLDKRDLRLLSANVITGQ
jgi:hypothetical protein